MTAYGLSNARVNFFCLLSPYIPHIFVSQEKRKLHKLPLGLGHLWGKVGSLSNYLKIKPAKSHIVNMQIPSNQFLLMLTN